MDLVFLDMELAVSVSVRLAHISMLRYFYNILTDYFLLLDLSFGGYLQDDSPVILIFDIDEHFIDFFVIILGFDHCSTFNHLPIDLLLQLFFDNELYYL